jgi:hypothetical protein
VFEMAGFWGDAGNGCGVMLSDAWTRWSRVEPRGIRDIQLPLKEDGC